MAGRRASRARDEADRAALMARDRAAMVFADCPYNVQISTTFGHSKIKHREFAVASGEMSSADFTGFLKSWMQLAIQFSNDGPMHYIFMDWRHLGEMDRAGDEAFGRY